MTTSGAKNLKTGTVVENVNTNQKFIVREVGDIDGKTIVFCSPKSNLKFPCDTLDWVSIYPRVLRVVS